jgi:hypothetical protein
MIPHRLVVAKTIWSGSRVQAEDDPCLQRHQQQMIKQQLAKKRRPKRQKHRRQLALLDKHYFIAQF